jgi:hypothetical protein
MRKKKKMQCLWKESMWEHGKVWRRKGAEKSGDNSSYSFRDSGFETASSYSFRDSGFETA